MTSAAELLVPAERKQIFYFVWPIIITDHIAYYLGYKLNQDVQMENFFSDRALAPDNDLLLSSHVPFMYHI